VKIPTLEEMDSAIEGLLEIFDESAIEGIDELLDLDETLTGVEEQGILE